MRQYCLRLQFHSTAAYNEGRKFFHNRYPTIRTLRKWLSSTDASPGITQPAIDELAKKVAEYSANGEFLHLCVSNDESSMRKHVQFNTSNNTFEGFPTVVDSQPSSKTKPGLPVAKDVWVFMVAGPNFKLPVAYFFLCGLKTIDRAAITREVITTIQNTGAKVVSLTADGLRANISVAKMLGADFNSERVCITTLDYPNDRIYVIFDPPHMIKLLRKYLATGNLYYKNDRLNWDLLKLVAQKQDGDNFSLGNKLSRAHINFHEEPMNVLKAAQTLSNGAADVIEMCREDGYEEFIGSESLVKFLRLCNDILDVMNYADGKPTDNHFKAPLCAANYEKFEGLFKEFEEFVSHMTIDEYKKKSKKNRGPPVRKPVLKSRSAVGFLGLLTNIKSIRGIYADYIQSGKLETFNTFQFSQDHLETYFTLVRSALGANNNPTPLQFKGVYRKLLVCMPHVSARSGNCILNSTNVLTVSSGIQPEKKSKALQFLQIKPLEVDMSKFDELIQADEEPYEQHLRAYVASQVEKKIIGKITSQSKIACQDCLSVFSENPKIFDAFIDKKSRTKEISQPCFSTVHILRCCDVLIELLQAEEYINFNVLAKTAFTMISTDELYASTVFGTHEQTNCTQTGLTHQDKFIYEVILEYMIMKSSKIGKRITIEEQNCRAIRRKLTRSIIFAGQ